MTRDSVKSRYRIRIQDMSTFRFAALIIAALAISISTSAQVRFIDGTSRLADKDKKAALEKMTSKFMKQWKKVNRDIDPETLRKVESEAGYVYVQRCAPVLEGADSTLTLVPTKKPIGLVIMTYGEMPLGCSYINEVDGMEHYPLANMDLNNGTADQTLSRMMEVIRNERTLVISGIDKPQKLVYEDAGGYKTFDLVSAEVEDYDPATQLPDYVYSGTQQHKPLAVIFSVIGTAATAAILLCVI